MRRARLWRGVKPVHHRLGERMPERRLVPDVCLDRPRVHCGRGEGRGPGGQRGCGSQAKGAPRGLARRQRPASATPGARQLGPAPATALIPRSDALLSYS